MPSARGDNTYTPCLVYFPTPAIQIPSFTGPSLHHPSPPQPVAPVLYNLAQKDLGTYTHSNAQPTLPFGTSHKVHKTGSSSAEVAVPPSDYYHSAVPSDPPPFATRSHPTQYHAGWQQPGARSNPRSSASTISLAPEAWSPSIISHDERLRPPVLRAPVEGPNAIGSSSSPFSGSPMRPVSSGVLPAAYSVVSSIPSPRSSIVIQTVSFLPLVSRSFSSP